MSSTRARERRSRKGSPSWRQSWARTSWTWARGGAAVGWLTVTSRCGDLVARINRQATTPGGRLPQLMEFTWKNKYRSSRSRARVYVILVPFDPDPGYRGYGARGKIS